MSNLYPYKDMYPKVGKEVYIAPTAAVIGNTILGDGSSVWFSAVVRGDVMPIRVGRHTSIQDNAVVHVTSQKFSTIIGNHVTVGHGAIVHGCVIEDLCIIGMGSVILDGAVIGAGSIVAAGAVVSPNTVVPAGSLVVGVPGKVKRAITEKEKVWIQSSADHYVQLSKDYS